MHPQEQCSALIVEDDTASSELIARALKRKGFRSETVGTVGAALIKFEEDSPPNMVILDLHLPDAAGTVVLRRVRRENRTVKVAVVTGVSDPTAFGDFVRYPPDAIFTKPVDLPKLIKWVEANSVC